MITIQSDASLFLYWLREGLHSSTRKLAREMGIELSALRALRDRTRKPDIWEADRMATFGRKMMAEGKIREPRKPYLWNWSAGSPLDSTVRRRPMVTCLKDFYT